MNPKDLLVISFYKKYARKFDAKEKREISLSKATYELESQFSENSIIQIHTEHDATERLPSISIQDE